MPIIATTNIKDKSIFNTMEFAIESVKGNKFKVNNEWVDKKTVFRKLHTELLRNRIHISRSRH